MHAMRCSRGWQMPSVRQALGRTSRVGLACAAALLTLLYVSLYAAPSTAEALQAAALTLTPSTGPPGTNVEAIASGFETCPPTGNDDVGPGDIGFFWDGLDKLAVVPVQKGSAATAFVVPESASLADHKVVARCLGDERLADSAIFTVTPPVKVPVLVPELLQLSLEEARQKLAAAKLVLGRVSGTGEPVCRQDPPAGTEVQAGSLVEVTVGCVEPALVVVPNLVDESVDEASGDLTSAGLRLAGVSGSGDTVKSQSPAAGAEVPRGTAVSVTLGPAVPVLVDVPNLVGAAVDDVPARLVASGLVLGQVSGTGEVVRSQRPPAGTQVRRGTAVSVSVQAGVPPSSLIAVPNVIGKTTAQARSAFAAAGLVLGNAPDGDGPVGSQEPAGGTLVPAGSAVMITLTHPAPRWPVGVLLVLLAAAVVGPRIIRSRRDRRWVRAHVRVRGGASQAPTVEIAEQPDASFQPTHVVRLEPRADRGTQVLEEVDR
jgi:beta-lactam-binding protein with PASTA domain